MLREYFGCGFVLVAGAIRQFLPPSGKDAHLCRPPYGPRAVTPRSHISVSLIPIRHNPFCTRSNECRFIPGRSLRPLVLARTAGVSATQGATYAPRRCSSFCFATNSASLPQNRIDRRHLLFCSRRQGICEPGRAHKRQTAIEFKRTASAHGFTFQIVGSNTDGTVTIENINYHLEQGKPIEPAILDGAQQIFVNAGIGYRIPCNGKGGRVFTLRHRLAREYDHATGKSGFGINQSPPGQGLRAKNTPE